MSATQSVAGRSIAEQVNDTVVVPDPFQHVGRAIEKGIAWEGVIGAHLADDECQHGRLAGDRTAPCGCWPGELS